MGPKVKDITKPHLRNIIRREGDGEVKGVMVDIILGKNQLSEDLKKCRGNQEQNPI
jgi:hypothetical protein